MSKKETQVHPRIKCHKTSLNKYKDRGEDPRLEKFLPMTQNQEKSKGRGSRHEVSVYYS